MTTMDNYILHRTVILKFYIKIFLTRLQIMLKRKIYIFIYENILSRQAYAMNAIIILTK